MLYNENIEQEQGVIPMKHTLSEKRVLSKLGIADFRQMTKDKVVKFASMLPYMDPEIAKKH